MIEREIPVTEDELHAYHDGELPPERREDVARWLAAHPADAARLLAWRRDEDALRARFADVLDEPVPARLAVDRLRRPQRRWFAAAIAATLVAFVSGGAGGWFARGATGTAPPDKILTADALDAHRLYVVEVRHPVEVEASERAHLQQWLSKRVGYPVRAPDLDTEGLKLVGGRLLPGPTAPAAFLMYESADGGRITLYSTRAGGETAQMRYAADGRDGALSWTDRGIGYVVSGAYDRRRLGEVARLVYDQTEKNGG
jgi:anti-sigma factor RsiW